MDGQLYSYKLLINTLYITNICNSIMSSFLHSQVLKIPLFAPKNTDKYTFNFAYLYTQFAGICAVFC